MTPNYIFALLFFLMYSLAVVQGLKFLKIRITSHGHPLYFVGGSRREEQKNGPEGFLSVLGCKPGSLCRAGTPALALLVKIVLLFA